MTQMEMTANDEQPASAEPRIAAAAAPLHRTSGRRWRRERPLDMSLEWAQSGRRTTMATSSWPAGG
eukprot:2112169-Prymnesium_polylepis.1